MYCDDTGVLTHKSPFQTHNENVEVSGNKQRRRLLPMY
jgi:hypothetical protein